MAVHKRNRADIRRWHTLYRELGLIASLGLLIVAFRMPFDPATEMTFQPVSQEVVALEDIEQTKQQLKPPPPPRPPTPIEVANDVVLEEEAIEFDAEIDFDAALDVPPPPPERREVVLEEPEEEIFVVVEQMPELIGGIASISENIRYPELARVAGVEGMVIVQFVVDEEGRVTDPVVVKSVGAGCDEEALRVIKTHARFTPGYQRGKAVRVRFSVPIRFSLK